jgi:nucleosome binding factor SPN SPT16 subunit
MHFVFDDLVLPLIINPNERIGRILGLIEIKQNGLCFCCKERITRHHAIVSSGRPRHYYHKDCAIKLHVI